MLLIDLIAFFNVIIPLIMIVFLKIISSKKVKKNNE